MNKIHMIASVTPEVAEGLYALAKSKGISIGKLMGDICREKVETTKPSNSIHNN